MTAIALLIDWENLKLALQNSNLKYEPGALAKQLRTKVVELASQTTSEPYLAAQIAFAPAQGFDNLTSVEIKNNGLSIEMTYGSGQAADLSIAIRAMQLYYGQGVRYFVIVSGDSDFIPLYEELNRGGSVCHMWLINRQNSSRVVQRLDRVAYVTELVDFHRVLPPTADQTEVYLMLCQRIIDHGFHLGSVERTRQEICSLGVIDDATASRMWQRATSGDHWIENLPGLDQDGKKGRARRLAYEREPVFKPLWLADLIVYRAHHDRAGELSRGEVISALSRQGVSEEACDKVLTSLTRAGYLAQSGNRYLASDPTGRYGLIGAGFRIALAFYAAKANGQRSMGMGQLIKDHWPRFFKVGGHLSVEESARCAEDAKLALNRAIAMRMAARCRHIRPEGGPVQGFIIDEDHPLTAYMKLNLHRAVKELDKLQVTHTQRIKIDEFANRMWALSPQPWSRAETEYWLGLLAAERVVTWTGGEIALNKNRLREEIEGWD